MRNFTFKRQLLFVMFMLLGCLSIQAADDDLITKQTTVKLEQAGTLSDKIGSSKKYKLTNLKIVGEINGADFALIRDMAGLHNDRGKLSVLDLSEAKVVSGGDTSSYYYTYNDHIGGHTFANCVGLTSLTLPSGVTLIDYSAFEGCIGLTSLDIPSGVTKIGSSAFSGCSGLTSLDIPSGVTEIGESTFSGCSGLTGLDIPSGVTEIGSSAFEGCSGLTSLDIPSGVTEIGRSAFSGCSGLTSIYVYAGKLPKMGSDVFNGCDSKKCIVYVPKGEYDDYWLSEFGYFENIVEFAATGIDKVTTSTDAKELSRYSVNGQRLSAPAKGLNIVKYSDGSVKKVAVQ